MSTLPTAPPFFFFWREDGATKFLLSKVALVPVHLGSKLGEQHLFLLSPVMQPRPPMQGKYHDVCWNSPYLFNPFLDARIWGTPLELLPGSWIGLLGDLFILKAQEAGKFYAAVTNCGCAKQKSPHVAATQPPTPPSFCVTGKHTTAIDVSWPTANQSGNSGCTFYYGGSLIKTCGHITLPIPLIVWQFLHSFSFYSFPLFRE